jgi:hypothetical protein
MYLNIPNLIKVVICLAWFYGCAPVGGALGKNYQDLNSLLNQRQKLESTYLLTLGHLENYPTDRNLRLKQADLRSKLTSLNIKIESKRQEFNMALVQWEQRLVQDRVEEEMENKVIKNNRRQPENPEWGN